MFRISPQTVVNLSSPTLYCFGDLRVTGTARKSLSVGRKDLALLAYLTVPQARFVRREQAAALLWPARERKVALHSFSQALYAIRRYIPSLKLEVNGNSLRVATGIDTDAAQLIQAVKCEDYQTMVRVYAGGFLAGFSIEDAPEFEEWKQEVAAHFESTTARTLKRALPVLEAQCNWEDLHAVSELVLKIDPYDQNAVISLAHATQHQHGTVLALRLLDETSAKYQKELPSWNDAAIKAARDAIEGRDVEGSVQLPSPFVGRVDELKVLLASWRSASKGTGRVAMVHGAAGMGKTRLCEQLMRYIAVQGGRTLYSRCFPSDGPAALNDLLELLALNLTPADFAQFPRRAKNALIAVFPSLNPDSPQIEPALISDPEAAAPWLFEAIETALYALSEKQPLALVVDDLQWASASTIALLEALAATCEEHRLLLVLVHRSHELPDRGTASTLFSSNKVDHVDVGPLSTLDAANLVLRITETTPRARLPKIQKLICDVGGGHPFFLVELTNAIASEDADPGRLERLSRNGLLTERIMQFIAKRFDTLSADALYVAQCLAILDQYATANALLGMSPEGQHMVFAGIRELKNRKLITEGFETYRFSHDVEREACYVEVSPLLRRILHKRAANVLLGLAGTPASAIAYHFERAEDSRATYHYAVIAANDARKSFCTQDVEHYLRVALNHAEASDQPMLMKMLADLFLKQLRLSEAEVLLLELEQALKDGDDLKMRLEVGTDLALINVKRGVNYPDPLVRLREIVNRAVEEGLRECAIRACTLLAICSHVRNGEFSAVQLVTQVRALTESANEPTIQEFRALVSALLVMGFRGNPQETLSPSDDLVAAAERTGFADLIVDALRMRGTNRTQAGLLILAQQDFERAAELAETHLPGSFAILLYNNYSVLLIERGDEDRATRLLNVAFTVATRERSVYDTAFASMNLAILHYECGRIDAAESCCRDLLALNADSIGWQNYVGALGIAGLCAFARGNLREASSMSEAVTLAIEAYGRISDLSYAEMLVARVTCQTGDLAAALGRLREALAEYRLRDQCCRARIALEYARLLRTNRPTASTALLRRIQRSAARSGAELIAKRANDYLLTGFRAAENGGLA